jgi:molybdate transport system ATP-binding protein
MSLEVHARAQKGDFQLETNFQIPERGVTAIFGPSGCGKTTLLRIIAGLERHSGCRVRYNTSIWQDDSKWIPVHERHTGMVFQKPALFPNRTVLGNLNYALTRTPQAKRRIRLEEAIHWLNLETILHQKASTLSGGEGQRVAIARALLSSPDILFMDEPLSALDQHSRLSILSHLESLRDRLHLPVVYVSHSLEEVTRLADTLLLLEDGRLRAIGPAADILTDLRNGLGAHEHAQALLEGTVTSEGIRTCSGGWHLPAPRPVEGATARIRVMARDVSLALKRHTDTSIQNILPATIYDIDQQDSRHVLIKLDLRGEMILSRITWESYERLHLEKGQHVYAQVKSVSLASGTSGGDG